MKCGPAALAVLLGLICTGPVRAAETASDVAVIFDHGGKFDKGFLESAFRGMLDARRATGITIEEIERRSGETYAQAVSKAAQAAEMIMVIGFAYSEAVVEVSQTRPDRSFTLIDAMVDGGNIRSVVFREQEGAFLIGALAARQTRTGTVGFIGAYPAPVIRRFEAGYRQGVRYEDANVRVISRYVGRDWTAFRNPYAGYAAAVEMIDGKADVLFAAAGATGLGVYQAAADRSVFAVGVDTSQNFLHPGAMLSSMIKRVDKAVHDNIVAWADKRWRPGTVTLGVKEGGVGYAYDRFNAELLSEETRTHLDLLSARIADGEIKVTEDLPIDPGPTADPPQ